MIRAPGGSVCFMMFLLLFFRWRSKTFGLAVLLPVKLRLFREPILLWTVCLFGKRPVCIPRYDFAKILFCHNIILPKYDFAKISFCHNIVLPQYHFGIILPKYCFFQNMVMPTVYRTFPGADVFIDWYIEITSIPLHLRIILCGFHQVTSQGRWFHRNHHPL